MKALLEAREAQALLDASIKGQLPDARGRFGPFGGRYIPETLVPAFERLEEGVRRYLPDADFQADFRRELKEWVGRPTALTHAPRLSRDWGADVWLKREDLAHTGAHKINNAIGQALLAKRLGAKRVIAETGAGQHGVASAAACAHRRDRRTASRLRHRHQRAIGCQVPLAGRPWILDADSTARRDGGASVTM